MMFVLVIESETGEQTRIVCATENVAVCKAFDYADITDEWWVEPARPEEIVN